MNTQTFSKRDGGKPMLGQQICDEIREASESAIIWLMCHYPDTTEMDERIQEAVRVQANLGIPIWIFGTSTAKYPASVEKLVKHKLLKRGTEAAKIVCSSELNVPESLDTIQETVNIFEHAIENNVTTILCISNSLQLLQVYGYSCRRFGFSGRVIFIPTRLRDWRPWYVSARMALIPLAFLGVGREFPFLRFVRYARSNWTQWPF
jgi:hypothetical protein